MPRIRYTDGPDELIVAPAGETQFTAKRLEWVDDVPSAVAKQLVAQGWERSQPRRARAGRRPGTGVESTKAAKAKSEKE